MTRFGASGYARPSSLRDGSTPSRSQGTPSTASRNGHQPGLEPVWCAGGRLRVSGAMHKIRCMPPAEHRSEWKTPSWPSPSTTSATWKNFGSGCTSRRFSAVENLDPNLGRAYHRVGYCPAFLDEARGFITLGTLLCPGYRKTPEYGLLQASAYPWTRRRGWNDSPLSTAGTISSARKISLRSSGSMRTESRS